VLLLEAEALLVVFSKTFLLATPREIVDRAPWLKLLTVLLDVQTEAAAMVERVWRWNAGMMIFFGSSTTIPGPTGIWMFFLIFKDSML